MTPSHLDPKAMLSQTQRDSFAAAGKWIQVAANDYLLREGQTAKSVFFLDRGLIGAYQVDDSGRQLWQQFYLEGSFASAVESLSSDIPTNLNLIALENSRLLALSKTALFQLYEQDTAYQAFGRAILTDLLVASRMDSSRLKRKSPLERYRALLDEQPELIHRVPLKFLASYLGIARETLSRVRGRL